MSMTTVRYLDCDDHCMAPFGSHHKRCGATQRKTAYDEGRWCGECIYGVVMDPPCCTGNPETKS